MEKLLNMIDLSERVPLTLPQMDAPRVLVFIDTEEDFDWSKPLDRQNVSVNSVKSLEKAHRIFRKYSIKPHYLVDYPIASSPVSIAAIRELYADGSCEIGSQLHPWVNPPHMEDVSAHNSYPGNLPEAMERAKLFALTQAIGDAFGVAPMVYRAGRYGIGPNTAAILSDLHYKVDVSVRAHFDYSPTGGPSFRGIDHRPFWLDEGRGILEIPLSNVFVGALARWSAALFVPGSETGQHSNRNTLLSRLGLLSRVGLTPEGMTVEDAFLAIEQLHRLDAPVYCVSFHSPSLEPGNTPYVQTDKQLQQFLSWLDNVLGYLTSELGALPATAQEIYAMAYRVRS